MNFKRYGVSKNVLPTSSEQVVENNGITYRSDGQGRYYITGTATSYSSAHFDITNFTIPISVGRGGSGTFSMFNLGTTTTNAAVIFMKNYTLIDEWNFSTNNRTNTTYSVMGDKEINQISLRVSSGTTVDIVVSPMFTNDGQLPSEFEPHMVWHDTPYYQHKTATDTLTLPAVIYPNDTSITVGIKGQSSQASTPTPQNPVDVNGCGDRTENLYDYSTIVPGYTYNSNGQMILNPDEEYRWSYAAVPLIEVESGATYLRTYNLLPWGNIINFYDSNKNFLEQATPGSGMPVTVPSNCKFVSFVFQTKNSDVKKYMFTKGSTAPSSYIPYGYKIPILSANTTTPVYLGEVQTTRKIKKLVLTGEETYTYESPYSRIITTLPNAKIEGLRLTQVYCTHFISVYDGRPLSEVPNNSIYSSDVSVDRFFIKITGYTSAADFKAYLAQQYANGTPVTVWYVLAEPTTGIVNEPLRKIGDYADTVSGISIPTITGADTFDVDTTLKPSEVSLSYTGWHNAEVKEWDGSEWQ